MKTKIISKILLSLGLAFLLAAGASAQDELVAWGFDSFGQVSGTPAGTFSSVAGGGFHSVAIRTDGTLVSWGHNGVGQVTNTPTGTFSAVAAGDFHSLALRMDGTLAAWGRNNFGSVSGPLPELSSPSLPAALTTWQSARMEPWPHGVRWAAPLPELLSPLLPAAFTTWQPARTEPSSLGVITLMAK